MNEEDSVRGIRLTFAELEVLNSDSPDWPRVRKVIGFDAPVDRGIIQGCGLASLLARELAVVQGGEIMVVDSLIDIAKRIREGTHWLGVTAGNPDGIVSTIYGVNDANSGRVYIAGVAPGVIEALPIIDDPSPVDQLRSIIENDLLANDLILAIKPEVAPPLLIQRLGDQWLLGDSANPESTYVVSTQADIMDQVDDMLEANLS